MEPDRSVSVPADDDHRTDRPRRAGRGETGRSLLAGRFVTLVAAPLLFGAVFFALGLWSTNTGPALTPDSVQYLSAAQNIASGRGMATSQTPLEITPPRVPFAAWPPLFPILLSLGIILPSGADPGPAAPLEWARILNLLAVALTMFPLAVLVRWSAGPKWVVPVLAFFAVFRPIHTTASFVWSESLFNLFLLSSLACVVRGLMASRQRWGRLLREPGDRTALPRGGAWPPVPPSTIRRDPALVWFMAAGLLASLCSLTRYLGISLLAAGGVAVIIRSETESMRKIMARLAVFLLPAGLPLGAWLVRNRMQTGHFFGEPRPESPLGVEEALHGTLRTLAADWAAPPAFSDPVMIIAGSVLGALAFTWIMGMVVRSFGPETTESRDWRLTTITTLMAFAVCYFALILFTAVRISYDPMNSRLLVSAYPALLVLMAAALRGAFVHPSSGRAVRLTLGAAGLALLLLNLGATIRYAAAPRESREMSWPYWRSVVWGDPAWAEEPGLAAVRELPRDTIVLSNIWEVVSLHTGRPSKPLPPVWDSGFPGDVLRYRGAYILVDRRHRHDAVGVREIDSIGGLPPGVAPVGDWGDMRLYKIQYEVEP